ncbi:alpha/beta hydrolase, partial [Acinetobacter baumannii]|nr:alpha/beta hydrolase [Acinetobacter baumannii]
MIKEAFFYMYNNFLISLPYKNMNN